MLCVVKMTELCWRWLEMRAMTFHMKRRATGSIPVLGSSKNMSGGSPIMAIATDSLRLLPPLSEPAYPRHR